MTHRLLTSPAYWLCELCPAHGRTAWAAARHAAGHGSSGSVRVISILGLRP